jgi:Zn finger protein HypA/HybF involved in hydrogenase expression
MFVPYFCLECEKTHQNNPHDADQDQCPFCGSTSITEDIDVNTSDELNWDEQHFEGNLSHNPPSTDIEE